LRKSERKIKQKYFSVDFSPRLHSLGVYFSYLEQMVNARDLKNKKHQCKYMNTFRKISGLHERIYLKTAPRARSPTG